MKKILVFISLAFILTFTNSVNASEIQYGHVEEVHDTELHIQYKGPAGEQNFVCDITIFDCESFATTTPELFPEINDDTGYVNSPDGKYGIVENTIETDDSTIYQHTIYDVSGDFAEEVAIVPYGKEVNSYRFPWGSEHVVLFGANGDVVTYGISTKLITTINLDQTDFQLRSLSPYVGYLSSYSYIDEEHKIWNTETGEEISVPSSVPAYVEFSQNEKYGAFIDNRDDYQTLYIFDVKNSDSNLKRVFKEDFTIEDYLWFKDKLYAVGNTEDNPYRWVLYEYNPIAKKSEIVAEDVSYGDYIRPVGEYALSFIVIEGKNSHVALYKPEFDRINIIRPVDDSPASNEIDRSVIEFDDDVKGVFYEPKNSSRKSDLFVWLHGGPKRQTSFGYHSYLSYAVYDELLEKLVESGVYVLKLDYAGSYGHGSKFMDKLNNNLGKIDVEHVIDASRTIQRKYNIDDTYLIGNSYGGYLGPKVLVERERYFDGAIAINGVFDWFDLITRIPSSPFRSYFEGLADLENLDTNFEMYEEASIIKDLPDLNDRKKLLLIYGEDDSTVPTWQTREFFYQANALDKDVEILKLEGEDHIIRERESLNKLCSFIADNLRIKNLECE